jgi:uncharacterized protein DUF6293
MASITLGNLNFMMACMMFKDIAMIKPYYAKPERYTTSLAKEERQETEGLEDIIPMPEYKIEMPDEKLIKCLQLINLKADDKITKRELKDAAIKAGLIHVDKERITTTTKKRIKEEYTEQAAYMSLNKNLIAPLRNWRFVTETKVGTHHIINLTDDGKNALKFLGTDN